MKTPWLIAVVLVSLAPTAQAQDGPATMTWTMDADQLQSESHSEVSGADAADLRSRIDQDRRYGNGDATVTTNEVDALLQQFTRQFTEDRPHCFEDFTWLRLDGKPPVRVAYIRMELVGAEGSTSSQAAIQHAFYVGFQYSAPTSDHPTAVYNPDAGQYYEPIQCSIGFAIGSEQDDEEFAQNATVFIHPLGQASFEEDSIRPTEAQQFWDGRGFRVDIVSGQEVAFPEPLTFTIHDPAAATWTGKAQDVGLMVAYGAAGGAGLLGLALLFTEWGRYQLLKLLFLLPGFTRVEKDEVLDHSKREELYNFIKTNPGPSFSDLRRSLELSNGTLVHHLRILETQEYVKAERDGFRTRFYVRGPKIVATSYLTRTQQHLLDVIRSHPGITQKELAGLVGLPRQNLSYHTRLLASQGKLEVRQDGNRRMYWIRGPATAGQPPRPF